MCYKIILHCPDLPPSPLSMGSAEASLTSDPDLSPLRQMSPAQRRRGASGLPVVEGAREQRRSALEDLEMHSSTSNPDSDGETIPPSQPSDGVPADRVVSFAEFAGMMNAMADERRDERLSRGSSLGDERVDAENPGELQTAGAQVFWKLIIFLETNSNFGTKMKI